MEKTTVGGMPGGIRRESGHVIQFDVSSLLLPLPEGKGMRSGQWNA